MSADPLSDDLGYPAWPRPIEGAAGTGDPQIQSARVVCGDDCSEDAFLNRVVLDIGQIRAVIGDLPDSPHFLGRVFAALAAAEVNVDVIVQGDRRHSGRSVALTLPSSQWLEADKAFRRVLHSGVGCLRHFDRVAKLSVVGIGVRTHGEIAALLFETLEAAGINIEMIGASERVLAVVVSLADAERAFDAACRAFEFVGPDEELSTL